VLEGNAPIGSVLRNHDFQLGKSVVDLVVAREGLACVRRIEDRVDN